MSALRGEGGQPKTDSCGQGEGGQPNVDVCIERKTRFSFFFVMIWKSSLSNINLISEYTVLDKIRLEVLSIPLPHTHTQIPFIYIISLPPKQKLLSNLPFYL